MSENFKGLLKNNGLSESSSATKREAAVCAALTLINSKVANSPDRSTMLREELENLSGYVDKIQAALQVK
jgi:hypothetical protein